MRQVLLTLVVAGTLGLVRAAPAGEPPRRDPADLGVPFERWTTRDSLGRTVTFYLARAPEKAPADKLPLVLFIQGSGCQSLFQKREDVVTAGVQSLLLAETKGRARVLVVEKPGVQYLDRAERPGTAA